MSSDNKNQNQAEDGGSPIALYFFLGAMILCAVVLLGYFIFGI